MELYQIIKYFGDDCSATEREDVETWVKASDENQKQFLRIKEIWETSQNTPDTVSPNHEKAWENIMAQTGINHRRTYPIFRNTAVRYFARIAAVVVILLGIGMLAKTVFLPKPSLKIEYTQETGIKEVQLADGSVITLNRNSRIRFPDKFKSGTREVKLEGEAFFKITKDTQHPFIVHANGTSIKVLGTSFNVKIQRDEMVQVSVLTGKVAFQSENGASPVIYLVKGDKGIYNHITQKLSQQQYTDENFLAWETGIISFSNKPLVEAAKDLEAYYNKTIDVHPDLQNRRITVTFNNLPLNETLDILKLTLNVQVENLPGKIVFKPSQK